MSYRPPERSGGRQLAVLPDRIRIAIADDHKALMEGFRLFLIQEGFEVVGIANTGQEAIDLTAAHSPHVLLLDIRMPDLDGLQALPAIKSASPDTCVLILTGYPTQEHMVQSFMLGASGFLSKSSEPDQICQAIRVAAQGDAIVDQGLLQGAMQGLSAERVGDNGHTDSQTPPLTEQETRVLQLIATGADNSRIADLLCVSRNTVKTHTRKIYAKLGVTDRTQAAVWAMRNGMAA